MLKLMFHGVVVVGSIVLMLIGATVGISYALDSAYYPHYPSAFVIIAWTLPAFVVMIMAVIPLCIGWFNALAAYHDDRDYKIHRAGFLHRVAPPRQGDPDAYEQA